MSEGKRRDMTRLGAICGTLVIALIAGSWTPLDAQHRVPGWGRVAPPGGHQNDLQLIRPTGGPVVPIFERSLSTPVRHSWELIREQSPVS